MDSSFEMYLINVGMRSEEFTHDAIVLYSNIEYFRRCYESNLSAYKALLFLGDYIRGDYEI